MALGIMTGTASAATSNTYGGITYTAEVPFCHSGTVTGESFVSGRATATRYVYLDLFRYSGGVTTGTYKQVLLVQGVSYNFFQQASLAYKYGGKYTVHANVQGGATVSAVKTFTFCP